MQTSTLKGAPVLCKFKYLTSRVRQLFKFGKAKQTYNARHGNKSSQHNNNNCVTENNNNDNSELCKLSHLLSCEMAQNAANEWLLQQGAGCVNDVDTYAEDMAPHVICLQTEAGHFYWNPSGEPATQQHSEIDWK